MMRPISAAGLTSPPCVGMCVIAISFVRTEREIGRVLSTAV
jgi:hypothetical protein